MRFVKPPRSTHALIDTLSGANHDLLVTLEEKRHRPPPRLALAAPAVGEYLSSGNKTTALLHIGLPDEFIKHGSQ